MTSQLVLKDLKNTYNSKNEALRSDKIINRNNSEGFVTELKKKKIILEETKMVLIQEMNDLYIPFDVLDNLDKINLEATERRADQLNNSIVNKVKKIDIYDNSTKYDHKQFIEMINKEKLLSRRKKKRIRNSNRTQLNQYPSSEVSDPLSSSETTDEIEPPEEFYKIVDDSDDFEELSSDDDDD